MIIYFFNILSDRDTKHILDVKYLLLPHHKTQKQTTRKLHKNPKTPWISLTVTWAGFDSLSSPIATNEVCNHWMHLGGGGKGLFGVIFWAIKGQKINLGDFTGLLGVLGRWWLCKLLLIAAFVDYCRYSGFICMCRGIEFFLSLIIFYSVVLK